jgi:hypothetical protein
MIIFYLGHYWLKDRGENDVWGRCGYTRLHGDGRGVVFYPVPDMLPLNKSRRKQ